MGEAKKPPAAGQQLGAGSFYGEVQARRERCDAIFTDLSHTNPRKLPLHSHELPFFELLLAGCYGERYGRQDKQFGPFTILFRPAGVPHQDEIGPTGIKLFEIELLSGWRKSLEEDSRALDSACDDCRGGELVWLAMKLFCETHRSADDLVVEALLAELLDKVTLTRHPQIERRPSWLPRLIEKVTADYSERLTLDELGAEAGVHPVHLSRVFRKCVGEGIGEYVRRLRIRAACEQMINPEVSMAEISLATGFADQSHFTRSFHRLTGMTPARFRLLLAGARQSVIAC